MEQKAYTLDGQPFLLPHGFHFNRDLIPLMEMGSDLTRFSLSPGARNRLKWFDYHRKTKNVALACRRFGISRKTFYYWKKRYDPLNPRTLEEESRAPRRTRKPETTPAQEQRIIALRKKYIRYSKFKLAVLYQRFYQEPISSWKIQRVIQKYRLYFNPVKTAKIRRKRQLAVKKKRITQLKKEPRTGFLICLDTIVIYWNNLKRYIFTAIDSHSKVSFARMYTGKSSKNAQDFLKRIYYLYQAKIENLQTDNGSEFEGCFEKTINQLPKVIERYFSRPRTPRDNPVNENFNGTLQKEFIQLGNFTPNPERFNKLLTEWLIEYNFHRPHQALGYLTPMEFHFKCHQVLPMCPSSAGY